MNRIRRLMLAIVFASLAMGCARDEPPGSERSTGEASRPESQPAKTESDAMDYTSAEVTLLHGDLANRTKRIEGEREIRRLLSFFPGAGRGREGPEPPAPWVKALVVEFARADGTVLRVTSNYEFWHEGPYHGTYFWSEGHGDWLLDDTRAFQTYLDKLFEEERKSVKEGQQ